MSPDIYIQRDWEIIGFIVTGYIGIIVITPALLHIINRMRNNKATNKMKYSTIISLISALMFCIMAGFFRSNIIFNNMNFISNGVICKTSLIISYAFYIISKFSMYILFTYRIEIVFGSSIYAASHRLLYLIRRIIIILGIAFIISIYFMSSQEIITSKYNISICTNINTVGFEQEYIVNYILIILFILTDFILSIFLLYLFCSKLYKMSTMLLIMATTTCDAHNTSNYFSYAQTQQSQIDNIESIKQIELQLIKQIILVCIAIFSTFLFLFIGSFMLRTIGWFIPLDMTINSFSVYLVYKFAMKCYNILCKPCICCCQCCIKYSSMHKQMVINSNNTNNIPQDNYHDDTPSHVPQLMEMITVPSVFVEGTEFKSNPSNDDIIKTENDKNVQIAVELTNINTKIIEDVIDNDSVPNKQIICTPSMSIHRKSQSTPDLKDCASSSKSTALCTKSNINKTDRNEQKSQSLYLLTQFDDNNNNDNNNNNNTNSYTSHSSSFMPKIGSFMNRFRSSDKSTKSLWIDRKSLVKEDFAKSTRLNASVQGLHDENYIINLSKIAVDSTKEDCKEERVHHRSTRSTPQITPFLLFQHSNNTIKDAGNASRIRS